MSENVHEVTGRPYLAVGSGGRRLVSLVYAFERRVQPWLCKVGLHDVWDVTEADGSIIDGYCESCRKITKPRHPQGPNPEQVREWESFEAYCCCSGGCKNVE